MLEAHLFTQGVMWTRSEGMKLVERLAREFVADGQNFDPAYWSNLGEYASGQRDGFKAGFRAARELAAERINAWEHGDTEEPPVTLEGLIRELGESEV